MTDRRPLIALAITAVVALPLGVGQCSTPTVDPLPTPGKPSAACSPLPAWALHNADAAWSAWSELGADLDLVLEACDTVITTRDGRTFLGVAGFTTWTLVDGADVAHDRVQCHMGRDGNVLTLTSTPNVQALAHEGVHCLLGWDHARGPCTLGGRLCLPAPVGHVLHESNRLGGFDTDGIPLPAESL